MKLIALLLIGVLPYIALCQDPQIFKNQLDLSSDLQYVGANYVYGLAPNGSVYESSDQGKSFQILTGISRILSIYQNPSAEGSVFLLGDWDSNHSYWVNSGKVSAVFIGIRLNQVLIHPKNSSMMLGSDKYGNEASFDLYLINTNTGTNVASVTKIREKVYNYYHCFAGFDKIPMGRICTISDVPRDGPQRFVTSNDNGQTWTTIIRATITTYTEHWSFILATDSTSTLWVSSDNATSFKPAVFPEDSRIYQIAPEQILSARPGSIFIGGHTGAPGWGTPRDGNVYASDSTGLEYALVADHINSLNNWWDFATVHELEGFYILNFLLQWENGDYVGPDGQVLLKTARTDNNAKNFTLVKAPEGSGCNVTNEWGCSLNLFGLTTWLGVGGGFYGDVYTSWNSPGFILGNGNAGPFLNTTREAIKTYISIDGGYNWKVLFNFPTIYAHSPVAGITVFVENQVPTTYIRYSYDGGLNVRTAVIDGTNERVCISISTRGWDRTFILKCDGPTYFVLDFSNTNTEVCPESQIEHFTPDNGVCILGRKTVYQRRKQGAQCSLPANFQSIILATNCPCTRDDYECDVGYSRTRNSLTCALVDPLQLDPVAAGLCTGNTYYMKSKGYRKVSGDTCHDSLEDLEAVKTLCPVQTIIFPPGGMSKGGIVALMLFFMLLVGVGAFVGGIIAGHKSHHIRERVPKSWISVEAHRLI